MHAPQVLDENQAPQQHTDDSNVDGGMSRPRSDSKDFWGNHIDSDAVSWLRELDIPPDIKQPLPSEASAVLSTAMPQLKPGSASHQSLAYVVNPHQHPSSQYSVSGVEPMYYTAGGPPQQHQGQPHQQHHPVHVQTSHHLHHQAHPPQPQQHISHPGQSGHPQHLHSGHIIHSIQNQPQPGASEVVTPCDVHAVPVHHQHQGPPQRHSPPMYNSASPQVHSVMSVVGGDGGPLEGELTGRKRPHDDSRGGSPPTEVGAGAGKSLTDLAARDQEQEEKVRLKKIRKRDAVRRCRQKQKDYTESLEIENVKLKHENDELQSKLRQLQSQDATMNGLSSSSNKDGEEGPSSNNFSGRGSVTTESEHVEEGDASASKKAKNSPSRSSEVSVKRHGASPKSIVRIEQESTRTVDVDMDQELDEVVNKRISLIRNIVDHLNRDGLDSKIFVQLFRESYHKDCSLINPDLTSEIVGFDKAFRYWVKVGDAFPDMILKDLVFVPEDERGEVLRMTSTFTGTHCAPIFGIMPSRKQIQVSVRTVFTFQDGKILHQVWNWNMSKVLLELLDIPAVEAPGSV